MAAGMSDAWAALNGKVSVPSELRTAEWQRVPQWVRERQFYMAGVHRAEILEEFRTMVAGQAAGKIGEDTAIKNIQQFLADVGYQPEPGQEGTIKDLRSVRRILVALRTNQRLLQGYGQKMKGLDPAVMRAFPAWELVRSGAAKVPRNWIKRFTDVGGEPINGRIIALKTDLVWAELGSVGNFKDAIGVDYPPLAWGSRMRWKGVPFKECKELGLLEGWTPPDSRPPLVSPNESLEMTPRVKAPEIRKALTEHLGGLAEWKNEQLVFTDPNGSRPVEPEKLVETWSKPMPEALWTDRKDGNDKGLFQRQALRLWSEDHRQFERDDAAKLPPGRLDQYDDLLRLFTRLTPMASTVPVYRGLAFRAEADFTGFIEAIRKGKLYVPRANKPADSWSVAESGARKYAKQQPFNVTLVCESHKTAKDISALVRSLVDEIRNPDPSHPLVTDGEVIFMQGARFKLVRIERGTINEKGGEATIYVEQL